MHTATENPTMEAIKAGAAWALAILIVWPIQYLIVVPAILLWRGARLIVGFALRLGLIGILLLFLPVIGWAILAAWLLFRRPDYAGREYERIARANRRSIFRPWRVGPVAA